MTLMLQEVAIVVVAGNNAPGALHIDFLRARGIVDGDWQLVPNTAAISSDMVSQVRFTNGLTITSVPDRITVALTVDPVINTDPRANATLVAGVAERYICALGFLQLSALGINLVAVEPLTGPQSPTAFLSERFIADGPWKSLSGAAVRPSVRFAYAWPTGGVLTVALDDGLWQPQAQVAPSPVVVINANLHRDLLTSGSGQVSAANATTVAPIIASAADDVCEVLRVASDVLLSPQVVAR